MFAREPPLPSDSRQFLGHLPHLGFLCSISLGVTYGLNSSFMAKSASSTKTSRTTSKAEGRRKGKVFVDKTVRVHSCRGE